MSELDWSDEQLIRLAEQIVEDEEAELEQNLEDFYSWKSEAYVVGGTASVCLLGSVALAAVETESWVRYPHATSVIGLAGMGVLSMATAAQAAYKAHIARRRLIE